MKKMITIEGMSCQHCVRHVKEALSDLDGVTTVEVDLASKTADIEASGDVRDEAIKAAIEDAGYNVVRIDSKS